MSAYSLNQNAYILPTPAGAFYAASNTKQDAARSLIFKLLSRDSSQELNADSIYQITNTKKEQDGLEIIYRLQTLGWIQKELEQRHAPEGQLVDMLPTLLPFLSQSKKALLSDPQGFYLATHGFSHEAAEELSALSADIAALHERHRGLLQNNMGLNSSAWAIVDSTANGEIGFWPLFIGENRFVLVLSGTPQFNHPSFVNLIWALNKRYNN